MGRDQRRISLSREAMQTLSIAGIKQGREEYINALVNDTVPQLIDELREVRELRRVALALDGFFARSGMIVQQQSEDGKWEWRQRLTEQARNGQRELERSMGGFPSKQTAQANALRRLDEDYSAWRATQDIE